MRFSSQAQLDTCLQVSGTKRNTCRFFWSQFVFSIQVPTSHSLPDLSLSKKKWARVWTKSFSKHKIHIRICSFTKTPSTWAIFCSVNCIIFSKGSWSEESQLQRLLWVADSTLSWLLLCDERGTMRFVTFSVQNFVVRISLPQAFLPTSISASLSSCLSSFTAYPSVPNYFISQRDLVFLKSHQFQRRILLYFTPLRACKDTLNLRTLDHVCSRYPFKTPSIRRSVKQCLRLTFLTFLSLTRLSVGYDPWALSNKNPLKFFLKSLKEVPLWKMLAMSWWF